MEAYIAPEKMAIGKMVYKEKRKKETSRTITIPSQKIKMK